MDAKATRRAQDGGWRVEGEKGGGDQLRSARPTFHLLHHVHLELIQLVTVLANFLLLRFGHLAPLLNLRWLQIVREIHLRR